MIKREERWVATGAAQWVLIRQSYPCAAVVAERVIEECSMHDLIIRGGLVVDGSGAPGTVADVAVADGRIVAVGDVSGDARRVIDAEGLAVTPGFIDCHTHMDAQLFWDFSGSPSSYHGVTTAVTGNCGFTIAPVRGETKDDLIRHLERAEDISRAALTQGVPWNWSTFAEMLDSVDAQPTAINYAANIGHAALRTWVMGERAYTDHASEDEIDLMRRELRSALAAGAIGFTTSLSENHATSDDRPVASRAASYDEISALVDELAAAGNRVFELAIGGGFRSTDLAERDASFTWLRELAVRSGVPVTFGTNGIDGQRLLDECARTVAAGGRMYGQTHSRGVAVVLSFETNTPFDRLPEWRDLRSRDLPEQLRMLQDPALRERLVAAADAGPYGKAIGAEARRPDFETIRIVEAPIPPYDSVADRARSQGVHPVDLMIDLALATEGRQQYLQPLTSNDPAVVLPLLEHPNSIMTFSDAGAHVGQVSDCSIHTHLLAYWVRQQQALTLERAVQMITSIPASAWGFIDRGAVRVGAIADLNVFDPAVISPCIPTVQHDVPGGGRRLVQRAVGLRATIVAGEVTLENGEHTGALPGQLLRR